MAYARVVRLVEIRETRLGDPIGLNGAGRECTMPRAVWSQASDGNQERRLELTIESVRYWVETQKRWML